MCGRVGVSTRLMIRGRCADEGLWHSPTPNFLAPWGKREFANVSPANPQPPSAARNAPSPARRAREKGAPVLGARGLEKLSTRDHKFVRRWAERCNQS